MLIKFQSVLNIKDKHYILEGIRDVIGRKDVVTLKKMVKLERPQGDKTDPKVMV